MELNTVRGSFEHVAKKQKLSSTKCHEVVDTIDREIEHAMSKMKSNHDTTLPVDPKSILRDLKTKLNELGPQKEIETTQKDLNTELLRYVKLLEKVFNPDISKAYRTAVDFDIQTLNQIVTNHFFRKGLFDIGDCLIKEAGKLETDDEFRTQMSEMYQIVAAIRAKDLIPALNWVSVNREKLRQISSDLELKLHQLRYVEILKNGTHTEALTYAQANLAPLAHFHQDKFQKLMTCLLWVGKLQTCPYLQLLTSTTWENVADELSRQFCVLLGESSLSPLTLTIEAGVEGLPSLLKLASLMAAKPHDWKAMKQLPVSVDLGKEFQFHSVFVCPVSRDEGSAENPPMLLPCGHVLCHQSIVKLSRSNSRNFKCPYCPLDAEVAQCKQLYF